MAAKYPLLDFGICNRYFNILKSDLLFSDIENDFITFLFNYYKSGSFRVLIILADIQDAKTRWVLFLKLCAYVCMYVCMYVYVYVCTKQHVYVPWCMHSKTLHSICPVYSN